MTQDEIQMPPYLNASYEGDDLYTGEQVRELIKLVAVKEREACAKVCDEWNTAMTDKLAAAIRARGEA